MTTGAFSGNVSKLFSEPTEKPLKALELILNTYETEIKIFVDFVTIP